MFESGKKMNVVGMEPMRSNQIDTLQVVAQQDAGNAMADRGRGRKRGC